MPPALRLLALALAALVFGPALASPSAEEVCHLHARAVEREEGIPRGLMLAIALTESGRYDAARRRGHAWPWTVTAGGEGQYLASKEEAIATVRQLQAAGRRNIDVGCMQVNLHYHPNAFADLEAAFDPPANVAYAAQFLKSLRVETRSWARAIARYHTSDPERGSAYRARVYGHWQAARNELALAEAPAGREHLIARRAALERAVERARLQRLTPVRGGTPTRLAGSAAPPAVPRVTILRGR